MQALSFRQLGRSSLHLHPLSFGASRLVGLSAADAAATVHTALEAGMNHLDTAPFYGFGQSELLSGQALAGAAHPFYLSSKVGRLVRQDSSGTPCTQFDYSYDGAQRSLAESLARLGRDRIDMAILHDVSQRWHGDHTDQVFDQALKGAFKAMQEWRAAGLVKALGIGINDCAISLRALAEADFDFLMLAGRTTLLDQQGFDQVLPQCQARGIGVIVAAPFNSGILATGAVPGALFFSQPAADNILEKTRQLEKVCQQHGVPLRAAALQLPLRHSAVTSVLAGYKSPQEVLENLQLATLALPDEFWPALVSAGLITPASVACQSRV
jgi:D-threo-aldose 1-dehydrogenase